MSPEELLKQYAAGQRQFSQATPPHCTGASLNGVDLSGSQLARARFDRAKLSGANFQQAHLQQANFSASELSLAEFSRANLSEVNFGKAVLERADFTDAQLQGADFSGADLKEAQLRQVVATRVNFNRADLRRSVLIGSNFEQSNFHSADLGNADLSAANLSHADLRQTNLSRANLQGANLQGANLRWADLSGADLRWADLSGAVLSGANLTGADLSHAVLLNTLLVHVDLTRANLAGADWAGADLSGAQLTGVKLYDVLPFGVKVDEVVCRWIDLSPNGDRSVRFEFATEDPYEFFYRAAPMVQVVVDARLNPGAGSALAVTYQQLVRQANLTVPSPSITVNRHRTTLSFELEHDHQLFLTAHLAIFPFQDADSSRQNLTELIKRVPTQSFSRDREQLLRFQQMIATLSRGTQQVTQDKILTAIPIATQKIAFFQAPTQVVLLNSSGQRFVAASNPLFGRRAVPAFSDPAQLRQAITPFQLPDRDQVINFILGFHEREGVSSDASS
jgi:uncharacterized protein YjbI with pentapeptide repeats